MRTTTKQSIAFIFTALSGLLFTLLLVEGINLGQGAYIAIGIIGIIICIFDNIIIDKMTSKKALIGMGIITILLASPISGGFMIALSSDVAFDNLSNDDTASESNTDQQNSNKDITQSYIPNDNTIQTNSNATIPDNKVIMSTQNKSENYMIELKNLKTLFDEGIITEEEFEKKKKKILGI